MLNFVARVHNSENAGYLEDSYATHADLMLCNSGNNVYSYKVYWKGGSCAH